MLKHLAIIMDGNRRWASERLLPRIFGHRAGLQTAERIIRACRDLGISYLTLYAFSQENLSRTPQEVESLVDMMRQYLSHGLQRIIEEGVRISFIGDRTVLPADIVSSMHQWEKASQNGGFNLVLAIAYSGRWDIIEAAKLAPHPQDLPQYLQTSRLNIPDPDLLIRTSGEKRVSNFLMWQLAYTELYFNDKYWPDFSEEDLLQAVKEFSLRKRRYGS